MVALAAAIGQMRFTSRLYGMRSRFSLTAAGMLLLLLIGSATALTVDERHVSVFERRDAHTGSSAARRNMLVTQVSARLDPAAHPAADPVMGTLWSRSHRLIVPVAGVDTDDLVDTFAQVRGPNRLHEGIDIAAPRGTAVLAAADGVILRLTDHDSGGITLYQLAPDNHTIFYYAHRMGYADGVRPGLAIRQGDIIGYVGDTGNAGPGNHHLHFEVMSAPNASSFWAGRSRNPYPLLLRARG